MMKYLGSLAAMIAVLAGGLHSRGAAAMTIPALDPRWDLITIKVDVRNLTGPNDAGRITDADMITRVAATNEVWSQCAIRFIPRTVANVSAPGLSIPYSPKSQEDLGRIAVALNPHGFREALPLTFAGPWNFYDPGTGLFLTGLGWVFVNSAGVDRIGAMIDSNRIFRPMAGALIAHEIAHALSLPHTADPKNLMGRDGTSDLTTEQCRQARDFARSSLASYLVAGR